MSELRVANVAAENWPERLPLAPISDGAKPFPSDALVPLLRNAVKAIARKIQVPEAMAAQSVIAAAALVAQPFRDVQLPYGQTRPLSAFLITIAGSGDRKTSADDEALRGIKAFEKACLESYRVEMQEWEVRRAAHSAQKKAIEGKKELTLPEREVQLRELGDEPPQPISPIRLVPDPTIEGLTKYWSHGPASLGIFSSEGGMFLSGHAMNPENRRKTGAALSDLWGGEPLKRMRAADGCLSLYGRRLSLHLMVQPGSADELLKDPILNDQGFVARALLARPDSLAGTRVYKDPLPEDDEAINAFSNRVLQLLTKTWPLATGKTNELSPPPLKLSPEATITWKEYGDHVEKLCGPNGEYEDIRAFVSKASEHVARLSGILTVFENENETIISDEKIRSAVQLVDFYLSEILRLNDLAKIAPRLKKAKKLLDWARVSNRRVLSRREIMQYGPNELRSKEVIDQVFDVLVEYGHALPKEGRSRTVIIWSEDD